MSLQNFSKIANGEKLQSATDQRALIRDLMISAGDKTAKVWHARTGRPVACFDQHTDEVKAACFIDNDHAASGSKDATIRVWRISDQKELARFTDVPDDRDDVPT